MKAVVDASAVLAVLLGEPDAALYLAKIVELQAAWMSPVNWWEVEVRMHSRYGEAGAAQAAAWMVQAGISVEPITLAQAKIAYAAHARYQSAPARLNLGDCFAYALARSRAVPLLYKGGDFASVDVESA